MPASDFPGISQFLFSLSPDDVIYLFWDKDPLLTLGFLLDFTDSGLKYHGFS